MNAIRDLLRIPLTDAIPTSRLESAYQRALTELTRTSDLFAHIQQIPTVVDQGTYTATDGTTRILAALHNGMTLMLVSSRSLDLLTTWQNDAPGDPEEWTMDKIPHTSALDFALHPRPTVAATGVDGVTIIRIGSPVNDDPPKHCYPYLLYKSASIYSNESREERDPQAAELWAGFADLWRELLII